MADVREQWGRVQRFRTRFAAAVDATPPDLLALESVPADRIVGTHEWAKDLQDFAVSACQQIHHLSDWAMRDESITATDDEIRSLVRGHPTLGVIADICNGTKHAGLDPKRKHGSTLTDPDGVARVIRIVEDRDPSCPVAKGAIWVRVDGRELNLLVLVDEALEVWLAFLLAHGIPPSVTTASVGAVTWPGVRRNFSRHRNGWN